MKKLGYIFSDRKIDDLKPYVGLVDKIESADPTKPLLIIGMANAKKYAGDKFSILNKQISENVYWTFKKTEKRQDYEKDILLFYKTIINNILNKINYYYINIIKLNFSNIKKIYNIIFSGDQLKYIFIKNDILYYLINDHEVIGISFRILKYCGISRKKVYLKIKNMPNAVIGFDSTENLSCFKSDFRGNEYVMPYVMSII